MRVCSRCGTSYGGAELFCELDGEALASEAELFGSGEMPTLKMRVGVLGDTCTACGERLANDGEGYCRACGYRLDVPRRDGKVLGGGRACGSGPSRWSPPRETSCAVVTPVCPRATRPRSATSWWAARTAVEPRGASAGDAGDGRHGGQLRRRHGRRARAGSAARGLPRPLAVAAGARSSSPPCSTSSSTMALRLLDRAVQLAQAIESHRLLLPARRRRIIYATTGGPVSRRSSGSAACAVCAGSRRGERFDVAPLFQALGDALLAAAAARARRPRCSTWCASTRPRSATAGSPIEQARARWPTPSRRPVGPTARTSPSRRRHARAHRSVHRSRHAPRSQRGRRRLRRGDRRKRAPVGDPGGLRRSVGVDPRGRGVAHRLEDDLRRAGPLRHQR